MGEQQNTRER